VRVGVDPDGVVAAFIKIASGRSTASAIGFPVNWLDWSDRDCREGQ
jgi:hypothetical protein